MMAQHTACLLLFLTFLGVLGASAISACPPPQDVAALEQGSTAADVEGFQGFDVTVLKAGETHRTLCPGALHLLNFTFTAEAQPASASGLLVQRDVTVFASKGQWLTGQEGGNQGSPSNQCPGLLGLPISTFPGVPSFKTHTLGLPCTASGKVVLLIAPVNQSSSNSSQGTPVAPAAFVFAIDPTCAASTCSSQERPVASAVDLNEGSSTGLSSPQALQDPSQDDHLGYKYTRKLGAAILHWTVGTEQAPDNECTAYQETTAAAARHAGYDGTLVHFALEANVSGYVAMGFTGRNSRMFPADIIMGWDDDNKGPSIDTYYVEGHHLISDMRTPHSADTWVTHKGVVQRSWINGVPRTIICFTRRLKEPKARVAQNITPPAASAHGSSGTSLVSSAAKRLRQLLVVREMPEPAGPGRVAITWAVSAHDRIVLHTFGSYGSATLDLRTGAMTTNQPWDRRENIRGHGIRNIVAWAFLLPFGSLVPAHRWVFGNRMWGPKPVWFWLHMAFQLSGYLIFIGGFFFMVAVTPSPRTNIATAHKNLGLAIVAAASAQVLFGFIRPTPDATYRWIWNLFHHNLGRVCVIASWVTILTGVVNYHSTVYDTSYAPWLISACILMAAVILTEVTLRICKPKDNTLPTRVPPIKDDMLQTSPSKLVTVPVTEGQQQQHGAASGSGLSSCDEATDNACTAVPGGDSEDTSSSEKDTYIQMDCSRPLSSTGKRVSDSEASGVSQASNPYPRRHTGGITAYTAGDEESALPCAAHGGRGAMSVAGGVGASDVSKPSAGGLRLR